jgi:hypothetical protein
LVGRQDAQAVERSGVRLRLRRQQAEAGDIDLLYLDESEALTHPYLARCWARRGADLRIPAPGQARRRALLGAWNPVKRRLLVHTSATKRSTNFIGYFCPSPRKGKIGDWDPGATHENGGWDLTV